MSMTDGEDVEDRNDSSETSAPETGQVHASAAAQTAAARRAEAAAEDDDTRTLWPFAAAAAVVGVILAAIVVAALRSPGVPEPDRVVFAVRAFVAAQNGGDLARRQSTECPGFVRERSPVAGSRGRIELVQTAAPQLDGDNATVRVTTKDDGGEQSSTWQVTKTPNGWRVCD